jgi:hypothetical protein
LADPCLESSIGSIVARGTPTQQKDVLRALFDRVEVDSDGRIVRLEP